MTQNENGVERALVVAAHPDDIEFGIAGTVAAWTGAGIEVTYCLVTDGAAGSNDPDANWDELVKIRHEEQMIAADCVGVKDVRFLGYRDGVLEPTLDLRRDITRIIRELRPQRVATMDPRTVLIVDGGFDYINHPDHRAAGEAALYATFPSAESRPIFPELLDEGFEPHHVSELWLTTSTQPNVYVDVSAVAERKFAALAAHKSQLDKSVVEMVRKWNRETGKIIQAEYAESFLVMRFPRDEVMGFPRDEEESE
jgi:LmbE family N-acetylglucosaminyl deacetylase